MLVKIVGLVTNGVTQAAFEAGQEREVDLASIAHVDRASYDVLDGAPRTPEMTEWPVKK